VIAEVEDPSNGSFYGTCESVVAKAVGDDLSFSAILLCGEGEGHKSGGVEVTVRACYRIDIPVVDMEFDVGKSENCVIRCRSCVFARAEKEIKCDGDEIGDGVMVGSGRGCEGLVEDEDDDNDWDWFYTGGRCVFLLVTMELTGDPEVDGSEGVLADVRGPQLGERMAHRADGVFHCTRSDGFMQGSLAAILISLSEDLDGGDWIRTGFEEWVNVVREATLFPTAPMRIRRSSAFSLTRQRSVRKVSLFEGGTCATALSEERRR
jgi:hypothetical protein